MVLEQVEGAELHLPDAASILPALALLLEIFDQILDRQAALHLELRVLAGLGLLED